MITGVLSSPCKTTALILDSPLADVHAQPTGPAYGVAHLNMLVREARTSLKRRDAVGLGKCEPPPDSHMVFLFRPGPRPPAFSALWLGVPKYPLSSTKIASAMS